MNAERLKELIEKIPFSVLLFLYLGYVGYDYYEFMNEPTSPLLLKKKEVEAAREANSKLEAKYKEMSEFVKSLENKKVELRRLAQALQDSKANLPERIDTPAFMKMVVTEAKKTGLKVLSLKPAGASDKEYYSEQTFALTFQGAYVQLIVFLDRLANATEIIKAENIQIAPVGATTISYVNLDGSVDLKTYRYIGTTADKAADQLKAPAPAAAVPASAPAAPSTPNKGGT